MYEDEKGSEIQKAKRLTPDVRVTPMSLRSRDHNLSTPSPSDSPSPGFNRGLYHNWHDH